MGGAFKTIIRPLIIAVILIFSFGCTADNKPGPVDKIKIGIIYPLSGDLARIGEDNKNGILLAVEEINRSGGIVALGGAKLEPLIGDTKGNPDISAREAERLIKEGGVSVLIGAYQSSSTKAATQVAERLKTPFISNMSIADIITERGFRYTFRICPKAKFYGRDQIKFLTELKTLANYPVKRVALLHENTDFGTASALAQKQALREQGLELVAEVSYETKGVTDLNKEVSQVLASKPDAILEVTYLKDSILIKRALSQKAVHIPLIDTAGGTVSPEYVKELGALAEGTFSISEYSKHTSAGKELNNRFHARFGKNITGESAYAYQAVLVLWDALERSGSTDKEKIRKALAATNLPRGPKMVMPAERLRFDENGQNEFARLFIVQIQNGELIPVWPAEFAAGKIIMRKN